MEPHGEAYHSVFTAGRKKIRVPVRALLSGGLHAPGQGAVWNYHMAGDYIVSGITTQARWALARLPDAAFQTYQPCWRN